MPSRYVIRNFSENGYYHVYNRGVEKRKIFLDQQDYNLFLYYLYIYLMPLDQVLKKYPMLPLRLHAKNLSNEANLISYCLMPNHFHLLIRQKSRDTISKLMKQLTNAYTLYFNQKYKRIGGLVQGRFRSVEIRNDELLLHVSRYIHLNPIASGLVENLENYKWSSYIDFVYKSPNGICFKDPVLSNFKSSVKYKDFINDQADYAQQLERIKHLTIED